MRFVIGVCAGATMGLGVFVVGATATSYFGSSVRILAWVIAAAFSAMFGAGLAGAFVGGGARRRNTAICVVVVVLACKPLADFLTHALEFPNLVSVSVGLACGGLLAMRRLSSMDV